MKAFLKVLLTIASLGSFFVATQADSRLIAMSGVLISIISTVILLGLLEAAQLIREEFYEIVG